jgi:hypothetical protein
MDCRIRKVKCDEGKPVCHRCLSTRRVCDGYGIWGGGGNKYGDRSASVSQPGLLVPRKPLKVRGDAGDKQHICFEWFMFRTTRKLPSAFSSGFWNTLVIQASFNEASVYHAILALSTVHMHFTEKSSDRNTIYTSPDENERFMLQHYGKSMGHLQAHFSAHTRPSVRVTLITCLLFTCLELLRGHYQSAIQHLEAGLRVLHGSDFSTSDATLETIKKQPWDYAEYWIAETFTRLYASTALFGQISPALDLSALNFELPYRIFSSLHQARHSLDRLLIKVVHLTSEVHRLVGSGHSIDSTTLPSVQRQLQSDLASWGMLYHASQTNFDASLSPMELFAYRLLPQFHTMAKIMTDTSLDDELGFESSTDRFLQIVEGAIAKFKIVFSEEIYKLVPANLETSKSICDVSLAKVSLFVPSPGLQMTI